MTRDEIATLDAFEIMGMGYEIGETCRECIDHYGRPCCDDSSEEDGSICGMLDDLHQIVIKNESED